MGARALASAAGKRGGKVRRPRHWSGWSGDRQTMFRTVDVLELVAEAQGRDTRAPLNERSARAIRRMHHQTTVSLQVVAHLLTTEYQRPDLLQRLHEV